MLKGTKRQDIWHILPGLAVPSKSLLPSWVTTLQAAETSSPASAVANKKRIWESRDFIHWDLGGGRL